MYTIINEGIQPCNNVTYCLPLLNIDSKSLKFPKHIITPKNENRLLGAIFVYHNPPVAHLCRLVATWWCASLLHVYCAN